MVEGPSIDALERLQRQAVALRAQAEKMTRTYNRSTWIRFVLVFFPIPFVVVLFRLDIEAWAYYVAGALIIASGAVLYTFDSAASDKTDAAVQAADKAEQTYEAARKVLNQPR
jgi:hypothetical protein